MNAFPKYFKNLIWHPCPSHKIRSNQFNAIYFRCKWVTRENLTGEASNCLPHVLRICAKHSRSSHRSSSVGFCREPFCNNDRSILCRWVSPSMPNLKISPINLTLPSILALAIFLFSSSSSVKTLDEFIIFSKWTARFSNLSRQLFTSKRKNVQHESLLVSKFGASIDSLLHNCAYIDEYLGSSIAFSKINNMVPFKIFEELKSSFNNSSLNFSKFSGVNLFKIPRTWNETDEEKLAFE